MTAESEIAGLDREIERYGEQITLQRVVVSGTSRGLVEGKMLAYVRPYAVKELVESIVMGDLKVILSPTGIIAARWPGGQAAAQTIGRGDIRVPTTSDKIVIQQKQRQIIASLPIYMGDFLVRLDLQVRG